jgi:hypothetical protein
METNNEQKCCDECYLRGINTWNLERCRNAKCGCHITTPFTSDGNSLPTSGQESWEIEFDEAFGKAGKEMNSDSIGGAGCDDCSYCIKLREEHKDFIRNAIQEAEKRGEEKGKWKWLDVAKECEKARKAAQLEIIEKLTLGECPYGGGDEEADGWFEAKERIEKLKAHLKQLAEKEGKV